MKTLIKTALLSATLLGTAGAASAEIKNAQVLNPDQTIAENAMKIANFSTLIEAVKAAGLADELMGTGPYTVFAPTDSAFAKLPEGTVQNLLKPENREQLVALLKAHIVPGEYTTADFDTAFLGATVSDGGDAQLKLDNGMIDLASQAPGDVIVEQKGDSYYVTASRGSNDIAEVIEGDIMASNGVIHVIDHVLTPNM